MKKREIIFTVLGAVLLFLVILIPWRHTESVQCAQNMAVIWNYATVWAISDNKGNMPANFFSVSNELSLDRLICPSDGSRQPARDWASFTASNASYVIVGPGTSITNDTPWLNCLIHTNLFVPGMRGFDPSKY